MSSKEKTPPQPVSDPLSMRDLAAVLVRHYGLTEGLYTVLVEFNVGVGPVGPDKENLSPGAMIGLSKIGLIKAESGPSTVDAAEINPKKKARK